MERELTHDWDRAVARARTLASAHDEAASILSFYADLLGAQAMLFRRLCADAASPLPTLEGNLAALRPHLATVLDVVARVGPEPLAEEARRMVRLKADATYEALLEYWRTPNDHHFFAKAILQPYGRWLAGAGVAPADRPTAHGGNRCPFCGGPPQLSVLHDAGELQGGGRRLLCATCLTTWTFPRVVCAYCGEEDDRKLAYFHTSDLDHLRVDGCDTCRRYIKSVDLTRLGLAVPLVDEVAGAPLDLWAREHGYEKIELNLVGL